MTTCLSWRINKCEPLTIVTAIIKRSHNPLPIITDFYFSIKGKSKDFNKNDENLQAIVKKKLNDCFFCADKSASLRYI